MIPKLAESISQCIQIGIHDIGISIVNDIIGEEMLYISLTKSRVLWTETRKSRVRPLSRDINKNLEELYKAHVRYREYDTDDKEAERKKYHIGDCRVSFISSSN